MMPNHSKNFLYIVFIEKTNVSLIIFIINLSYIKYILLKKSTKNFFFNITDRYRYTYLNIYASVLKTRPFKKNI